MSLVAASAGKDELFGKMQNHLATWQRSSRLEKTQMSGRNISVASEVQLAKAATPAPIAQQIPHRLSLNAAHPRSTVSQLENTLHYL